MLTIVGRDIALDLPLAGAFQIYNVLCAADPRSRAVPKQRPSQCFDTLEGVPGRMQRAGTVSGGSVYIDYAHTPEAVENVLSALRPHTPNRRAVIGCGGDRIAENAR